MPNLFFMRCTNRTELTCIEKNLLGESKQSEPFLKQVKIGDIGVLLNLDSRKMIGPWTAVSPVELHENDAWLESIFGANAISFEAQIKVKPHWGRPYRLNKYYDILESIGIKFVKVSWYWIPKKSVYDDEKIIEKLMHIFDNERSRSEGLKGGELPF